MKKKPTVFVTGVGGCGVGEGIAKAVLWSKNSYRLLAGNMHANAPMLFRSESGFLLPPASAAGYVETMLSLCRIEGIDVLIPGSEAELRVLCGHADRFRAVGTHLIASQPNVVKIGDDKWLTHEFLAKKGFDTPDSCVLPVSSEFITRNGFPLVVKPRIGGHASQNVFIVDSREELDVVLHYLALREVEPIIQEYVGAAGDEYTISVITGHRGQVLASIAMRRSLLGGFTQRVEIEDFFGIRAECERVAACLETFGPVNIQARLVGNRLKIFEINPRFSGTTPFRAAAGFNEVEMLIEYVLTGNRPEPPNVRRSIIGIRSLEEMLLERSEYEEFPRMVDIAATATATD